ncbi:unnamed protein product [Parnassius mnemosyne]|uniref:SET domain-containing protein n=2 Tax=Parnassius mnemosyne TaxID=213953 RepID=A0AAV1KYI8_9NEOP
MFLTPNFFNNYLRERGLGNQIYAAMKNDDYSDVVMAALSVLEESGSLPTIEKENKCEKRSDKYREEGNIAFKVGNVYRTLEFYNRALMYAPKTSRAIKLAYSNRSAILFKMEQFSKCLIDIETCCKLGCPTDIESKLIKRKNEATKRSKLENSTASLLTSYFKDYFKFDLKSNTSIPCASSDIEVIKGDDFKIVAAKDIKVGTPLALEDSFVSCNNEKNIPFSCHYCHKMSLNLIPCEGCCLVLFCSEECKEICLKEYHSIECQIMEVIQSIAFSTMAKLMVKGTLKFVQMCGSWKKVISSSHCTGADRIRISSEQDMYDVNNKFSVLNFNDNRLFVHGSMHSASFVCATFIYYLERISGYLPSSFDERKLAKKALGRIMMYFSLYASPTPVNLRVSDTKNRKSFLNPISNHGWYPLIGKLKESCIPNLFVINLNKKMLLIALKPIKKGSELTVSHIGHYLLYDEEPHVRNSISFDLFGNVCNCIICTGEWKSQKKQFSLTEKQLNLYKERFLHEDVLINIMRIPNVFKKICNVLACLSDVSFSEEYVHVFNNSFFRLISAYQEFVCANVVFDRIR